MKRRFCAWIGSIACLIASSASAQPLADRVPQDALFYAGWAGTSTLEAAYRPSHLKAVLDESRFADLFGKYLNDIEAKVVRTEPEATEAFRIVRTLGAPVWKYPTAVYLGTPDLSNPRNPMFPFVIATQAGADAPALAAELNKLLVDTRPPASIHARATVDGDIVCFSIGLPAERSPLASRDAALVSDASFTAVAKQVQANPAAITYLNFDATRKTVLKLVELQEPVTAPKVATFIEASGLGNVSALISTHGFDDKDWVSHSLLATSGPRTGLLASIPEGAVDPSLMKIVPEDAAFFASVRFDAAKFITETRAALTKSDPEAARAFNMGISAIQQAIGVNPVVNILEPMGSDWVLYNSPRTGGAGVLGLVVANKLDEPDKVRKSLVTASVNLVNWMNVGVNRSNRDSSDSMSVRGITTKIGDVEVYYIGIPIIAPSWAIADGRLYLGLYPQTVAAAARQANKGGPSIVDSPKYQAVIQRLGVKSVSSSSYYDLPTIAGNGSMYAQLLMITRYAGFGDLFGVTLPEPLLPPMDILMDHLSPAGSACWIDEAGFHKKSITPFPGAKLLTEQGAIASSGVGGPLVATSILLPSLNRARETANRVKSASNLKQIGLGIALYANENRGKYPDDLGIVLRTQDLVPEVFTSPRTNTDLPADIIGNMDAAVAFVNEQSDYIYIGQGLTARSPAELIVAYENPNLVDEGINVLFADGHVEFMFMDFAIEEIERQKKDRGIE